MTEEQEDNKKRNALKDNMNVIKKRRIGQPICGKGGKIRGRRNKLIKRGHTGRPDGYDMPKSSR